MFSLHVLPVSLHAPSLLSGFPPTDLDVRLLVSLYWLYCMHATRWKRWKLQMLIWQQWLLTFMDVLILNSP